MEHRKGKTSLKTRLIEAFFITSIFPIILMNLFSYYNTSRIVRDNINEQAYQNLNVNFKLSNIDGATKVKTFFKITLPLLKPTIESVLILGFIYTFKVFDLVYVMTGGGPVNSTHMLSTYSYKLSFEMFKYSKGSAVANVLLVILLAIGIFYMRATTKEEEV